MYKTECLEEMEKRKADVLGTDIRAMKLGPVIYVPRVFVKSSQMGHKHRDRSNTASFDICAATKTLKITRRVFKYQTTYKKSDSVCSFAK